MGKASKEYFRDYYARRKAEYVELLGGQCNSCGASENLQFDHRNPEDKAFSISKLMNYSKASVLEELERCQLLCANCHLEKSKEEGSLGGEPHNKGKWKHGTTTSYMAKGCRCDECKKFYSAYKKQRRAERGWK